MSRLIEPLHLPKKDEIHVIVSEASYRSPAPYCFRLSFFKTRFTHHDSLDWPAHFVLVARLAELAATITALIKSKNAVGPRGRAVVAACFPFKHLASHLAFSASIAPTCAQLRLLVGLVAFFIIILGLCLRVINASANVFLGLVGFTHLDILLIVLVLDDANILVILLGKMGTLSGGQ